MHSLSRRSFLSTSMISTLSLGAAAQPSGKKVNILLLLTDDQGAHLGCLGTPGLRTPAIDTLAASGQRFTNAFAATASCSPSRSALLTGLYPHTNGHWRNTHTPAIPGDDADYGPQSRFRAKEPVGVHEDIPTLVELLRDNGYVIGVTQKFHLSPPWKYPFRHRLSAGMDPGSHRKAAAGFFQACGDAPFFLMANIGNTHRPFRPHLRGSDIPPVQPGEVQVPDSFPDTPAMRADYAEYLSTVQCADACAGAILEALRASGQYDNTVILFTSDQGFCYHRAKATAYDAGLRVPFIIAGPDIAPGRTHDHLVSHVDVVPTLLDFVQAPQPANLQGRSLTPLLRGDHSAPWRSHVFGEHNAHGPNPKEYYPIRCVWDGRMHYIRNLNPDRRANVSVDEMHLGKPGQDVFWAGPADMFPGGPWGNRAFEAVLEAKETFPAPYRLLQQTFARPAEELYDLSSDPDETRNLAEAPQFQDTRAQFRQILDQWMSQTKDPGMDLRETPRRG
jgi:N-sulfoglucosamine sulfohydrolase